MRSSFLSRSVLAAAALAVGGALAAPPAGAATPSGVTASTVVSAALLTRAGPPPGSSELAPEALRATEDILLRSCDLKPGETVDDFFAEPVQTGNLTDGLLAAAFIDDTVADTSRICLVGATAVKNASSTLSGTATLTADVVRGSDETPSPTTATSVLSGDVVVTGPISVPDTDTIERAMFTATGSTVEQATQTYTIHLKKTVREKRHAKRLYTNSVKKALKTYQKAIKKAGTSTTRKKAAKKAYTARKKVASAKYKKYVASRKTVTRTRTYTSRQPFTITTPWV
jgi:hypothetical protein